MLGHACLLINCIDWHAGFVLTTVEAIGDITATEEASALATFGDKHNRRVQGGLLGDGQYVGHNKALFGPKTSLSMQKSHPYTGHLNSETSRDSKNAFVHCGDGLVLWPQHRSAYNASSWGLKTCSMPCGTCLNAATVTAHSCECCCSAQQCQTQAKDITLCAVLR